MVADVPGGTPGVTAMAVYALLSAGVEAKDDAVVRAVAWITGTPEAFRTDAFGATVSYAMRVLAFARLDPARFRAQIRADAETIETGALADGTWTDDLHDCKARRKIAKMLRESGSDPERGCVFMSHLAVQALWVAREHAGHEVGRSTWARLWHRLGQVQREDGTWTGGVPIGFPLSRTSTAAALGSYVLARAGGPEGLAKARAAEVTALGTRAWKGERMPDSGYQESVVEYAFHAEHTATACGWVDADWFVEVAEVLVEEQWHDGSWLWGHKTRDRRDVRSTAAALLCLCGGSRQLFEARGD
jgi:hypothetical protein